MPGDLGDRLREKVPGWGECVVDLDCVDSTNTLALALGRAGAPEGSVVVARRQRKGRGRWSRAWSSPEGGLYASILLRPAGKRMPMTLLPLLVSVAASETIARRGAPVRLQWPNDLYVDGRKLAGVLCESSFGGSTVEFVAAGVGINVNPLVSEFPETIRKRVTSLRSQLGGEADPGDLLVELLERLARGYAEDDPVGTLERFRSFVDGAVGVEVRFESSSGATFEATTDGIAADGGLRVRLRDGSSRVLYAEEVHRLRDP